MADHLRNWYDEATTKERIEGSSDDIDIKQLDENIHVFQVSSKTCEGMHLTEECTLPKEDKTVEQNKYMRSMEETIIKFCEDSIKEEAVDDEWIRKFIENTDSNIRSKTRKTMGKENVKEPVPRDLPVVQTCAPPSKFLGSPSRTYETGYMMGIPKENHKVKAQEDEGNTDDGWDITVKNVDRFRQILTPTIHTLSNLKPMVQSYVTQGPVHNKEKVVREKEQDYNIPLQDNVMQPLTPQTVHITPPDDNYVTLAINPILNKNEFGEEFANNTSVSEKIDSNPVTDLIGALTDIYVCDLIQNYNTN
ncbi:hypothetical protein Tco_1400169 [Tanacetum coccineum]